MRCPTLAELPPPPEGKTGWPWTKEIPYQPDLLSDGRPYPKVSIVTPSFNQGEFIEETIRSVLLQGYPNLEYCIIDGGSTDESVNIIRKYEHWVHYWVSEPDEGQTDAINKGLKRAAGDIVAYLNSDDVYCPGAVNQVIHFFDLNPNVSMVYGDVIHIDQYGQIISNVNSSSFDIIKYLMGSFYLPQPTVFFKSILLKKIGYFDTKYNLAMDKEYWVRVIFNCKTSYLSSTIAIARIYDEAKSIKNKSKYLKENLMILDSIFERPDFLNAPLFLNKQIYERKKEIYGSIYLLGGCSFLKERQVIIGLINIFHGCKIYPLKILDREIYLSLFEFLIGTIQYKKIIRYIKRVMYY